MDQKRIAETEAKVMVYLQQATDLRLSLSSNEEDYHTSYVAKKVTECATCIEKLSDIQMALTKISIEVTKLTQEAYGLLKAEKAIITANPDYAQVPGAGRDLWMMQRLGTKETIANALLILSRTVAEVKQAVSDRIQTFKRLDSDIRLHSRLLEGGTGSNATGPRSFVGKKDTDLEL